MTKYSAPERLPGVAGAFRTSQEVLSVTTLSH
jgi:hypothetical protein